MSEIVEGGILGRMSRARDEWMGNRDADEEVDTSTSKFGGR